MELTFAGHSLVKKLLYAQRSIRDSVSVLLGRQKTTIPLTVEPDPPPVYMNFKIAPHRVVAFERRLALPNALAPTPVRCLRGEAEDLLLTLKVYRVNGPARGMRAEWSTYVCDWEGKPRHMVVEARCNRVGIDPVDIIARPSRVEHRRDGRLVTTRVVSEGERLFCASFQLPDDDSSSTVKLAADWVSANDHVYRENGVCDRVSYDAGLAHARVLGLPEQRYTIADSTRWSRYVESSPKHVLVVGGAMSFMNPN